MEYFVINVEKKRVTFARFEMSRRSTILVGAASFDLGEGFSLSDAAIQIASSITPSLRVILCLPPALFAQRLIPLSLQDLRKVREVLPFQVQGEIAMPVEELVLDVLPAGDGTFLAMWARKTDISRALELFREAGIEPQVVSSLPFAWSFIPGMPVDCAVCDGNTLAVLNAGQMSFFSTFDSPVTSSRISATLSALEQTGVPLPERLSLIGTGSEALAACNTAFPFPVSQLVVPADMGHLFKNEDAFQQLVGLYAVAKASHAGALPDFRRGELLWTAGDARMRKRFLTTSVLVVMVIVLLFVGKWLQYRAVNSDIVSLNKSISSIYREIFPTRTKAVDEIAEIKGEIRKLTGSETSSGFLDILKKLSEAKGDTINGLYEAEIEGRSVRLKGDARSAQAAGEFKSVLSPLMSTIELGEVKSRPDGTVSFSLTGTLKESTK